MNPLPILPPPPPPSVCPNPLLPLPYVYPYAHPMFAKVYPQPPKLQSPHPPVCLPFSTGTGQGVYSVVQVTLPSTFFTPSSPTFSKQGGGQVKLRWGVNLRRSKLWGGGVTLVGGGGGVGEGGL